MNQQTFKGDCVTETRSSSQLELLNKPFFRNNKLFTSIMFVLKKIISKGAVHSFGNFLDHDQ